MRSALYHGIVSHHRQQPRSFRFSYGTFMVFLYLDELESFFATSRFWSLEKFNWASFRRADYLRPQTPDLHTAVTEEILEQTGQHFSGEIALLTHCRYLGYCFNPVSFYYCFTDQRLQYIVAEVNNTPWNERHRYVLRCDAEHQVQCFITPKQFHVSPFMSMQQHYKWTLSLSREKLSIVLRNFEDDEEQFSAHLGLHRLEATPGNLNRILWRFPAITLKTIAAIYWQALKLWLKGIPLHPHPQPQRKSTDGIHPVE